LDVNYRLRVVDNSTEALDFQAFTHFTHLKIFFTGLRQPAHTDKGTMQMQKFTPR